MDMLDLIHHYDQWGMRQNHASRRNNNRFDDPNSLLISVGHEAETRYKADLDQSQSGRVILL